VATIVPKPRSSPKKSTKPPARESIWERFPSSVWTNAEPTALAPMATMLAPRKRFLRVARARSTRKYSNGSSLSAIDVPRTEPTTRARTWRRLPLGLSERAAAERV